MRDLGRVTEIEDAGFLTDQLIQLAIFFKEIVVVMAGNQKNVPDLEGHQLLEIPDPAGVDIFDFVAVDSFHLRDQRWESGILSATYENRLLLASRLWTRPDGPRRENDF